MGTFRKQRVGDGLAAVHRFNYTRDVLEPFAAAETDRTALVAVDSLGIIDRRTFPAVAGDANRWAALLRAQGLAAGDRILVRLPPGSAWCGVVLGALKAGIVVVPCSPSLPLADVVQRARETQARLLLAEELSEDGELEWLPVIRVADAMAQLRRLTSVQPTHKTTVDDLALIVYTAGATSVPVGAAHTHRNVWAAKQHGSEWLATGPGDVVWCSVDTGSPVAIWDLLGAWSTGATIVLHANAEALEIEEKLELVDKLGVTVLSESPPVYAAIVETIARKPVAIPRLRRALSTRERLSPELIQSFRAAFGLTIHNAYVQAESLALTANLEGDESKDGSIGRPLYGAELAVITNDGAESGTGVEGDLAVIGDPPSHFAGYWNNADAMESSMRGYWFITGDRAVIDEDGYFWLAGRTHVSRDEHKQVEAAEAEAAAAAQALAEAEREERHWAEAQARAEAEERARREAEAHAVAVAEAEERERAEAEAQARAEAEARAREEEDARGEAEERAQALARREAEEWEARLEAEERARAEALALAAAEASAGTKAEAERHAEAEARAQARADQRARKRAAADAKAAAAAEAKAQKAALAEAKAREQAETKARNEAEAEAKAREKVEAKKRAKAEAAARKEAEAKARAEAKERERALKKGANGAEPTTDAAEEETEGPGVELYERLRAYGRSAEPPSS